MHIFDAYKAARDHANFETFRAYGVHAPYEPNTEAHDYWLILFDYEYKDLLEKSK